MSKKPGDTDGIPNIPERIAIALSGGGSRAAVFHFGTLDYLDRVGLLSKVRMISAVSGGSFTGAKYAMCLSEPGSDYNRFFGDYYSDLYNTKAVADTFKRLGRSGFAQDRYRVPSGRRSLITAAADVYAHSFLASKLSGKSWTFGQLLHAQDTNPDYPLDVVVLNATEYSRGYEFRFARKKRDKHVDLGDGFIAFGNAFVLESIDDKSGDIHKVHLEDVKDIRIADIVAASSCLPGVFDPIVFPNDFGWPDGKVPPRINEAFRARDEKSGGPSQRPEPPSSRGPVPLMDGGIYDNQGIESLILADQNTNLKRLAERLRWITGEEQLSAAGADMPPPPDLFIVSDADREEEDIYPVGEDRGYQAGERKTGVGRESLWRRVPLWIPIALAMLLSGVSLAGGGIAAWRLFGSDMAHQLAGSDILIYLSAIGLALPTAVALGWGILTLRRVINHIPQTRDRAWFVFLNVHFGPMIDTLQNRWRSTMATFQDVMPKRTSNLGYWVFYSDPRYKGRRLSNRIYDLTLRKKYDKLENAGVALPSPSGGLSRCINRAATMETAFWFKHPNWQIPTLLTCGQATICFNLMLHLVRRHGTDPGKFPVEVKELWDRLHADWMLLQQDPYALIKERIGKPGAQPKDGHGKPIPLKCPPID